MLVTILTFSSIYMREKPALEGIAGHSAQVTHLAQRGKPVAKNFGPPAAYQLTDQGLKTLGLA